MEEIQDERFESLSCEFHSGISHFGNSLRLFLVGQRTVLIKWMVCDEEEHDGVWTILFESPKKLTGVILIRSTQDKKVSSKCLLNFLVKNMFIKQRKPSQWENGRWAFPYRELLQPLESPYLSNSRICKDMLKKVTETTTWVKIVIMRKQTLPARAWAP